MKTLDKAIYTRNIILKLVAESRDSLEDLGALIGISKWTMQSIIAGERIMRNKTMDRVIEYAEKNNIKP